MLAEKSHMALPPLLLTEFIGYVLQNHKAPTTLVICSSRETFLDELRACIDNTQSLSASRTEEGSKEMHALLTPTIHLIAKSQSVKLAFVPTLPHLRAFLGTHTNSAKSGISSSTMIKPGSQTSMLAICGIARLHISTAEHSAQGLSRTLAAAVEAAKTGGQGLVLAELNERNGRDDHEAANDGDGNLEDPWKEQVPLLSGRIRFGGEERSWAERTIEVGKVAAKWCTFVSLNDGSNAK